MAGHLPVTPAIERRSSDLLVRGGGAASYMTLRGVRHRCIMADPKRPARRQPACHTDTARTKKRSGALWINLASQCAVMLLMQRPTLAVIA